MFSYDCGSSQSSQPGVQRNTSSRENCFGRTNCNTLCYEIFLAASMDTMTATTSLLPRLLHYVVRLFDVGALWNTQAYNDQNCP